MEGRFVDRVRTFWVEGKFVWSTGVFGEGGRGGVCGVGDICGVRDIC